MRRPGYLAALAGAPGAQGRPILLAPRRVFAAEPAGVDVRPTGPRAPDPAALRIAPPVKDSRPSGDGSELARRRPDEASRSVTPAQPPETVPAPGTPALRPRSMEDQPPAPVADRDAPAPAPVAGMDAPPAPPGPRAAPPAPPAPPALAPAPPASPARPATSRAAEAPIDQAWPAQGARAARERAPRSERGAAANLHIATVEVTVLPAPAAAPPPAAVPLPPAPRRTPAGQAGRAPLSRGAGPWYGLAQR
jgi:Meckel syndrome type 1 protein